MARSKKPDEAGAAHAQEELPKAMKKLRADLAREPKWSAVLRELEQKKHALNVDELFLLCIEKAVTDPPKLEERVLELLKAREESAKARRQTREPGNVTSDPSDEAAIIHRAVDVIGDREEALRWLGTPVRALGYATPISKLQG